MELPVKNIEGEQTGTLDVSDFVWNAPFNPALLHQVVVAQAANQRLGTKKTLSKSEVRYSTHKIRAQKGGGRSRQGSRKSPHMRGGGVAHGPKPRSFRKGLPKKMRRQALRVVLSEKLRQEKVSILDELGVETPKTKFITSLLDNLGISGTSVLIVTEDGREELCKSVKNAPRVSTMEASQLNPLVAAKTNNLVITANALDTIDRLWAAGTDTTDLQASQAKMQEEAGEVENA